MTDVPPPPPPAQTMPAASPGAAIPPGTTLSSLGKRFGGALLSTVLIIVTLFIGYAIWAVIAWNKGQTPAKQILKMYVIDTETGQPATWGKMALRGFVLDGIVGGITGIYSLISAIWIFTNPERQRLTDKIVSTVVVDAPNGLDQERPPRPRGPVVTVGIKMSGNHEMPATIGI